jgi:hypothetical protein
MGRVRGPRDGDDEFALDGIAFADEVAGGEDVVWKVR